MGPPFYIFVIAFLGLIILVPINKIEVGSGEEEPELLVESMSAKSIEVKD